MENRDAEWGIGILKSSAALPKSVGSLMQVGTNVTLCAFDDDPMAIEVAYKLARQQLIFKYLNKNELISETIDKTLINEKISNIRRKFDIIKQLKGNLTSITNSCDTIKSSLDELKQDIFEELAEIKDEIFEEE